MRLPFTLALSLLLTSCFKDSKLEITNAYIINENWKNDFTSFFEIERMKVKQDSVVNIFEQGFKETSNNWNIVNKLEIDSTFVYHYSPVTYDTIFFNKPNEGNWRASPFMKGTFTGEESKTIGNLERNSWYKLSGLRANVKYYVFVYVDSVGKTHLFDQNLANF